MPHGTRLAAAIAGLMFCLTAYSQTGTSRPERELFAAVNQARHAQGLAPLRWNEALATAARRHAEVMAAHGSAQHGYEGEPGLSARAKLAGARFGWLSENVIQWPLAPELIHTQFMQSSSHRANILDRDMDSVGIAAIERGGRLYVVEDFSQAR